MKKGRSQKVIENAEKTLLELLKVYEKGIAYDKYLLLLNEYKILSKRSETIIKISDEMEKDIYLKNESLVRNLDYTIEVAKKKLLFNVSEHKKSKNTISIYKKRIDEFQEVLDDYINENLKLKNKLETYKKCFGELKSNFYEEQITDKDMKNELIDLTPLEYKGIEIEEIVEKEFLYCCEEMQFMKIRLKSFDELLRTIQGELSVSSFLKSLYKFICSCFSKDAIILHTSRDSFFILAKDDKYNNFKESAIRLNSKRELFDLSIFFYITIEKFDTKKDNLKEILLRCENKLTELYLKSNSLKV